MKNVFCVKLGNGFVLLLLESSQRTIYANKNETEIQLYFKTRHWNYKNINKKINHYIAVDKSSNTRIYMYIDKQTHTQIIIHRPVLPEKKVKSFHLNIISFMNYTVFDWIYSNVVVFLSIFHSKHISYDCKSITIILICYLFLFWHSLSKKVMILIFTT